MITAKWLLFALLAMPAVELAVFIVVAAAIGLGPAFLLLVGMSLTGALVLRYAAGGHIERYRATLGKNRIASLQADASGFLTLVAGILLLMPGFITGLMGLMLLIPPLRLWLGKTILSTIQRHAQTAGGGDGVVDLKPDEWRQVPEERLTDQRTPGEKR